MTVSMLEFESKLKSAEGAVCRIFYPEFSVGKIFKTGVGVEVG